MRRDDDVMVVQPRGGKAGGQGHSGQQGRKRGPRLGLFFLHTEQAVPPTLKEVMDLHGEMLRKTLASTETCLDLMSR